MRIIFDSLGLQQNHWRFALTLCGIQLRHEFNQPGTRYTSVDELLKATNPRPFGAGLAWRQSLRGQIPVGQISVSVEVNMGTALVPAWTACGAAIYPVAVNCNTLSIRVNNTPAGPAIGVINVVLIPSVDPSITV